MINSIRVEKVRITNFKRIHDIVIELSPITALVGGNTSGKSSALQAIQLCVSLLQASYLGEKGRPKRHSFSTTLSDDDVLFKPTENLLNLRHRNPATQDAGYKISLTCSYANANDDLVKSHECSLEIRRGKNANLALKVSGDLSLAAALADQSNPFSIFTPGLSGIPLREEWRTRGALDAGAMHGDANLYLRTLLDHLFSDDYSENDNDYEKKQWNDSGVIDALPVGSWKTFCRLLDRCYSGVRIVIDHDPRRSRYVDIRVKYDKNEMPLDMASTGMLQVIQILAYACYYKPPLLLLDEPDAHLHADSQGRLYEALRGLVNDTNTRILLASHSPQLIQRLTFDPAASTVWIDEGARVPVDHMQRPAIPILMTLGALNIGADVFDPNKTSLLLTEDRIIEPIQTLAISNGAENHLAILSYNGCGNLSGARQLARLMADLRPDLKVVIHRDRDFRTDTEVRFEIEKFKEWCALEGIERVSELFTSRNDVEHHFVDLGHLEELFGERVSRQKLQEIIEEAMSDNRDNIIIKIRDARKNIEESMYKSERLRKKPIWARVGMTEKPPKLADFIPASGKDPLQIAQCYGKGLLRGVLSGISKETKQTVEEIERIIYRPTQFLQISEWQGAFVK